MAMLLARACPGVTSAEVVTHELAHALGAVPRGAPHGCPPPDDGHTCDNQRDLMYPYTDGSPLTSLTLDPGRDDYYGHSGGWTDTQDSAWLVRLDSQTPLTSFDLFDRDFHERSGVVSSFCMVPRPSPEQARPGRRPPDG